MTPETLYANQARSLNRGTPVLLSVTLSTNVAIQVAGGSFSISGVKAPCASSLTSSSKRYCTCNVVSHDCVSMHTKKDYGLYTVTCLEPTASTNISYCAFILLKSLPPGAFEKSSITDQTSFLTSPSMSLRQNCLSIAKAAECTGA